jgi:hypothetical protein
MDLFACRECNALYAIHHKKAPPTTLPRCEVCRTEFPSTELGEWLDYEKLDAEQRVKDWLPKETG